MAFPIQFVDVKFGMALLLWTILAISGAAHLKSKFERYTEFQFMVASYNKI